MIIPIRTQSEVRRPPLANYLLIGANMLLFLLLDEKLFGDAVGVIKNRYLVFDASEPAFYQFFTYQFLHADVWHLFGNLLFLWVFGNSVNSKMGDVPYLLFYLAGGVFAAWGWAAMTAGAPTLLGASGAIATVTTAYLALFPRARVTVMVWVFFIYFFDLSAMLVIGLKIIVWDNIIAPSFGPAGNVAHSAHLAGYLFGFAGALGMLLVRAIPRDQFDILALWRRWRLRREFASAMAKPGAAEQARYGRVARAASNDPRQRAEEDRLIDAVAALRDDIAEAVTARDLTAAADAYEKLMAVDPKQCLSERQQLEIAQEFYRNARFAPAVATFRRYLESYPNTREANDVRLLVGIIYARDLRQYEQADECLTQTMEKLHDDDRRAQCRKWLAEVRGALGRPVPE